MHYFENVSSRKNSLKYPRQYKRKQFLKNRFLSQFLEGFAGQDNESRTVIMDFTFEIRAKSSK